MELRLEQLREDYQAIQALDLEWYRYLNGLEAGDFKDQGFQDQDEYCDESGYLNTLWDAMDLEAKWNSTSLASITN